MFKDFDLMFSIAVISIFFLFNAGFVWYAVVQLKTRTFSKRESQIHPEDVDLAFRFIKLIHSHGVILPTLMIGDRGNVGMYWDNNDIYIDIEVDEDHTLSLLKRERATGDESFLDEISIDRITFEWITTNLEAFRLPRNENSGILAGMPEVAFTNCGEIITTENCALGEFETNPLPDNETPSNTNCKRCGAGIKERCKITAQQVDQWIEDHGQRLLIMANGTKEQRQIVNNFAKQFLVRRFHKP